MSARRLLLLSLNLALAASLALMLAPFAENLDAGPVNTIGQGPAAAPEKSVEPAVVEATVSKPLFNRLTHSPPTEPAPRPLMLAPAFRLAGVLWGDAGRLAIVQLPDDAGHRRVRIGESIEDWKLSELTPRSATFDAGERRAVMSLEGR